MRSAGIRLNYLPLTADLSGVKTGILLEAGFDQVAPNTPCDFTSWAYEYAIKSGVTDIADNRAVRVDCYNPEYTLVEKLHAISRKFRQQQQTGSVPQNFMRHYYDVYHLLDHDPVLSFIGTPDYTKHKAAKFSANDNPDLTSNQAFILSDLDTRKTYEDAYQNTRALYYADMPEFTDILNRISQYATRL